MDAKTLDEVELLSFKIQDTVLKLMSNFFEKNKVSYAELRILRVCDSHENLTLNKLSEVLNKAPANLSVIITKLVKSKLLRKKSSQVDKRVTYIVITEKGKKISDSSYSYFFDLVNDDISDELNELLTVLKKYYAKLNYYMNLEI
ncbi:MarR family winged helix-turn-helix transcriptional regulator [Breznakia pachnodae]|uniref:DNA-binding MarR family transcriptional regulator n=1 Tax=Breznakia pachnodae TaxID=265178 RepID=A0ABU0E6C8_9FIRM|nr:MarR family transcriptional regulator [Breznakia pachnodae]MDQ0362457.1 DNA-binding MarR family transcriptional regulator [Breznakia pachnodae]